jgi:hypothetical protein
VVKTEFTEKEKKEKEEPLSKAPNGQFLEDPNNGWFQNLKMNEHT